MGAGRATLFLCGDVMTGRGVDQILPHPGAPDLREGYVRDAGSYVRGAEAVNGRIVRPVPFSWPWGSALREIEDAAPDVRVLNLETSITSSGGFEPGKRVHYRMSPGNVRCLSRGRPDVCVLANNHVLDFGRRGLEDTLGALRGAGMRWAGAGRDAEEAGEPATVVVDESTRVVVVAGGVGSSGIPPRWAATANRPGVNFLPDLSEDALARLVDRVRAVRRPGDLVLASLHWGSNWGYGVSDEEIWFAHRLVEDGVDVVHGHSSHHPRPIEVFREKLILYGCGDFIDDYEGITGFEEYRDDLRLLYFPSLARDSGRLLGLRMVPVQARQMRLHRATTADAEWLAAVLDRVSRGFGTRVELESNGALVARPG